MAIKRLTSVFKTPHLGRLAIPNFQRTQVAVFAGALVLSMAVGQAALAWSPAIDRFLDGNSDAAVAIDRIHDPDLRAFSEAVHGVATEKSLAGKIASVANYALRVPEASPADLDRLPTPFDPSADRKPSERFGPAGRDSTVERQDVPVPGGPAVSTGFAEPPPGAPAVGPDVEPVIHTNPTGDVPSDAVVVAANPVGGNEPPAAEAPAAEAPSEPANEAPGESAEAAPSGGDTGGSDPGGGDEGGGGDSGGGDGG